MSGGKKYIRERVVNLQKRVRDMEAFSKKRVRDMEAFSKKRVRDMVVYGKKCVQEGEGYQKSCRPPRLRTFSGTALIYGCLLFHGNAFVTLYHGFFIPCGLSLFKELKINALFFKVIE